VGGLGVRWDEGTGLHYMRQRWYDPGLGRFISQDELYGLNRYRYGYNNPLSYIDVDGMKPIPMPHGPPLKHSDEPSDQVTEDALKRAQAAARKDHPYAIPWKGDSGTSSRSFNCISYALLRSRLINHPLPLRISPSEMDRFLNQYIQSGRLRKEFLPQVGDIVIYRRVTEIKGGALNPVAGTETLHAGIVEEIDPRTNTVWIVSKWGSDGKFKHQLRDVPDAYKDASRRVDVKYYRPVRPGNQCGC
jgi:RHS repeat-associated protein